MESRCGRQVIEHVRNLFEQGGGEFGAVVLLAREVSGLTDRISPFIQENTDSVCPSCQSVCCINRHSYHDLRDIVCIIALGEEVPPHGEGLDDSEPCQFLGQRGCTLRRSLRPYRCNWYFCTPLLTHIMSVPASRYRAFIAELEQLSRKREEMLDEYQAVTKRLECSRKAGKVRTGETIPRL